MTHDHTVTAEWDRRGWGPEFTFHCHAPALSPCHAMWTCDCESLAEQGIRDGIPWHRAYESDDEHTGELNPQECSLRDWFENTDEALRGSVTFPVTPDWQGDYVLFNAVDEYPRPQTETLPIHAARTTRHQEDQ